MFEAPYDPPPGRTLDDFRKTKPGEGDWRERSDFVCVHCGGHAFLHPYTNLIWGCPTCGVAIYVYDPPNAGAILSPHFRCAPVGAEMT